MIHHFRQQHTISAPVVVSGYGFWSGRDVAVEFRPAPPGTGIVFVRCDFAVPQRIPALVQYRIEVPRRTTLVNRGTSVEMVEHILAALAGMQIDNCEIWVNNSEMPGCDGSSLHFIQALARVDRIAQGVPRAIAVVTERMRVGNDDGWVEVSPSRSGRMSIKYRLDYREHLAIGRQTLGITITPAVFQSELAPARTFLLKEEADWLHAQGLGTRVTCGEVLVFGEHGPINNELRYDDECVRHKVLDLIGDLALAGCDLIGHFTAYRAGHRLHAEMVKALLAEGEILEGLCKSA